MSSSLTDARKALAELLTDVVPGVPALADEPEVLSAPSIVIGPGDPWIEFVEGTTFGSARVRLSITYIADALSNDQQVTSLEDAAVAIIAKVDDSGVFATSRADQPGLVSVNGQDHLGAVIQVFTDTDL